MVSSILVICMGNICRSPVGERLLKKALPEMRIASAGLNAVVGAPASDTMQTLAVERGLDLRDHRARQLSASDVADYELWLVMESDIRRELLRGNPALCGKVKLFGQWLPDDREITDPWTKSPEFHTAVFRRLEDASRSWKDVFCPDGR